MANVYFKYDIHEPDDDDYNSPWFPAQTDPFGSDSETCIVCGNLIVVESLRMSSLHELFTSPSDGLSLLSKVFKISSTIHKQLGTTAIDDLIAARSDQDDIRRIYLYCLGCATSINDSLNLLVQIEELQKRVCFARDILKKNLICTFENQAISTERDDGKQQEQPGANQNELDLAKNLIRKSYVQCFTPCTVNLINCNKLPVLNTTEAVKKNSPDSCLQNKKKTHLTSKLLSTSSDHNGSTVDPIIKVKFDDTVDDKAFGDDNASIYTRTRRKIKSSLNLDSSEIRKTENTKNSTSLVVSNSTAQSLSEHDEGTGQYFELLGESSSHSDSESDCGSLYTPDSPGAPNTDYEDKDDEDRAVVEGIEVDAQEPSESAAESSFSKERKKWLTERGILTITRAAQIRNNYKYKCDVCGKRYYIKNRFDMHVKCHKGEWDPEDAKFEVQPKPKFKLNRSQILSRNAKKDPKTKKAHRKFREIFRIKHVRQNGAMPYQCQICGKGYRRQKRFEVHQECHKLDESLKNADNAVEEHTPTVELASSTDDPLAPIITSVWSAASGSISEPQPGASNLTYENEECEEVIQDLKEPLQLHLGQRNPATHPYICNICGKSYKFSKSFETHKTTHTEKINMMPGSDAGSMEVDQNSIESQQNLSLPDNSQLSDKKEEIKDYPFRCSVCSKGYFIQDCLYVHEQTYHRHQDEGATTQVELMNFPCPKCDAKFTTQKYLNYHDIKMHRYPFEMVHNQVGHLVSFKCGWCSKAFEKVSYMTESGEWNFTCDKTGCGKRLSNFISFSWHHGGCCDDRPPRLPDQLFQCEYCGKQCKTLANLEAHRTSLHTKQYQFYCEKCGTGFSTASALKAHMLCHEEVHAFKCDQCGKTFKRKRLLVNHVKWHNNDRKYVCSTCGKRFVAAITLKNHEATHTAVKNTPCPICNKMFANKNYVWEHVYSIHERRRPPRKKKSTGSKSRNRNSTTQKAHSSKSEVEIGSAEIQDEEFAFKVCV